MKKAMKGFFKFMLLLCAFAIFMIFIAAINLSQGHIMTEFGDDQIKQMVGIQRDNADLTENNLKKLYKRLMIPLL